ncbi:MAG TPA: hypothetical protein VFN67_42610 [Polyangiales bacterium]|nr:hypothetical protein [Polyangiales bacterium]
MEAQQQSVVQSQTCPFCAEDIKPNAKKCKHCGETLDVGLRAAEEAMRMAQNSSKGNVYMNAGGGGGGAAAAAAAVAAPASDRKPRGSYFWLIFWCLWYIVPGVIYYMCRRWDD